MARGDEVCRLLESVVERVGGLESVNKLRLLGHKGASDLNNSSSRGCTVYGGAP